MNTLIQISEACITTPGGRPLFDGLNLSLARDHVALVGRNGVGKSTLLAVLAGAAEVHAGRVKTRSKPHLVPQGLRGAMVERAADSSAALLSHGELRRLALGEAMRSGADILLLDEPTEDLDEAGVAWLRAWLLAWPGCLVVASHDRRLLADFRHFLVPSESGCRYFGGTLPELDAELEREHREAEQRYVRNLNRLVAQEEHTEQVTRRRARKKRYGRCSELDRATPRIRLNQKRDHAQVYQGKLMKLREARLDFLRQWSKSTRRALGVSLPLDLPVPVLPEGGATGLLVLRGVSASVGGRRLFPPLDLELGRQRVAVVGPNGAGKTTLLEIMLGRRAPTTGSASCDLTRTAAIEQGGANWMLEESLLSYLSLQGPASTPDEVAALFLAHRFPLGLAERPLRTLSPGERARAALICLFRRSPPASLLILDEPTHGLDLVGQRAMTAALRSWPGGLVVASHDRAFLAAIGIESFLEVGA
jgi:ATPase subunit of ABC transporter with duplicated ATPase domains